MFLEAQVWWSALGAFLFIVMSCCSGKGWGNTDSAYSWGGGTGTSSKACGRISSTGADNSWLCFREYGENCLETHLLSSEGLQGCQGKLALLPIFSSTVNLYLDKRWASSNSWVAQSSLAGCLILNSTLNTVLLLLALVKLPQEPQFCNVGEVSWAYRDLCRVR